MLVIAVLSAMFMCVHGQRPYPPPAKPTAFTIPYLGLDGHKFFIPNPNALKGAGMNDNIFVRNHKRAKAVARYFRYLLLGSPALNYRLDMEFDPEEALRWRKEYVRKFGYRGERLIDFLGSGPSKDQIIWSLGTVY